MRGAQVVVPATMAVEPTFQPEWLDPGVTVVLVSSLDGPESLHDATDLLVVDDWVHESTHEGRYACRLVEAGIVDASGDEAVELCDVVAGRHPGRTSADQRIVVSPVGLGMDDVTTAKHVLDRAAAAGLGTELRLRTGPSGLGVIGGPLLRTADGRLFLAAQLMDSLSAGISLVALPWLVLDAGGTQSQAGAAFLAGTLPYVVLGLNAGHVGDHRPRRRVMVTGTAVQTAAAAVIPLALAGGVAVEDMPLALIYAAALVVTAGRVFVDAAAFGAIAKLVGGGHFVQGQSALSFVWSLGFLVGPAVGGALIGLVGISGALWVQAVGFAVAVGLMASMRVDLGPDPHPDAGGEGVLAGLRLVIRDPVLRSLTAIGMAWNLTTNVIYSLIVVFARHDLSADAGQAGLMLSIAGAAGLAGGLLAPVARHRLGPTRALRSPSRCPAWGRWGRRWRRRSCRRRSPTPCSSSRRCCSSRC